MLLYILDIYLIIDVIYELFFFVFFLVTRRPPKSPQCRSSAASDVYKRQLHLLLRRAGMRQRQRACGPLHGAAVTMQANLFLGQQLRPRPRLHLHPASGERQGDVGGSSRHIGPAGPCAVYAGVRSAEADGDADAAGRSLPRRHVRVVV